MKNDYKKSQNNEVVFPEFKEENVKLGNTPKFLVSCIDQLNKNMNYSKGLQDKLRVVHHNADFYSPFPQNNANDYFPCTIFLPDKDILKNFKVGDKFKNNINVNLLIKNGLKNNIDKKSTYFIIDNEDKKEAEKLLNSLLSHFHNNEYRVAYNFCLKTKIPIIEGFSQEKMKLIEESLVSKKEKMKDIKNLSLI